MFAVFTCNNHKNINKINFLPPLCQTLIQILFAFLNTQHCSALAGYGVFNTLSPLCFEFILIVQEKSVLFERGWKTGSA